MYDDQRGLQKAAAARDEHAFLAAAHCPDLMLVLDTSGLVLWASPSHREILGFDPVGRRNVDVFHADDRIRAAREFERRVATRAPSTIELSLVAADGRTIEVESTGVPVVGHDGQVDCVVVTARKINDRRAIERRMRVILDQLPANVWTTDRDMNVTSSVGGGLSPVTAPPEDAVGRHISACLEGDTFLDGAVDLHQRVLRGETFTTQTRWRDRDLHVRMYPLRDDGGEISGVIGISFDVTDQRRAERRYQALFERNLAGVFRSTVSGRLLECNEAFARIFGYDSVPAILANPTPSLYFDAMDREALIEILRQSGEALNYEVRLRRNDGEPVWALINEKVSPGDDGGEEVLEGTLVDITARKQAEARMQYQAFHDALTDLPNRFLFNDRLALALAQAYRHGRAVAVLFLDLDQFKLINDTMAHSAGDELLRAVAVRLLASVRSEDTVARIGGDEFVFILPEVDPFTAATAAAKVAEKVLDAIRYPFVVQSRELFVTASIGIAVSPHDGEDAETLIRNADSAMYRAKELGRDNYQFHTPMTQRRAEIRLTLETALRHAIERDEFFLLYQPVIDTATGSVTALEALLRWNRPGVGVVSPREFIPLAEEIGIIVPIGEWVLWTACRQMAEWQRAGASNMRLAINISTRQFHDDHLVAMVEDVLSTTGLDPASLELEITESLSMRDSDLTIRRLSDFRQRGIGVALDDFGTGYSSLSHLRYLPLTRIKIDQSFIEGLRDGSAEKTIIGAIVAMGHSLGLRVVGEGVETEQQHRILTELGCDEVQGFVHSEPLTPAAMARLLNL